MIPMWLFNSAIESGTMILKKNVMTFYECDMQYCMWSDNPTQSYRKNVTILRYG